MVKEAIAEIKKAEEEANRIIAQAKETAAKLLFETRKRESASISAAEKEAEEVLAEISQEINRRKSAEIEKIRKESEREKEKINQSCLARRKSAVQLVIKYLS